MRVIVGGRQTGKTSRILHIARNNLATIVVPTNTQRVHLKPYSPRVLTLEQVRRETLTPGTKIVIDEATAMSNSALRWLLSRHNVVAMAFTPAVFREAFPPVWYECYKNAQTVERLSYNPAAIEMAKGRSPGYICKELLGLIVIQRESGGYTTE